VDWASAAVGLGGLVVAALSTYIAYRARTSPYQERLYDRQLDAFGEILRRLGEVHDQVRRLLPADGAARLDAGQLRLGARAPVEAFIETYRNGRIFLTEKINAPIRDYVAMLASLPNDPEPRKALDEAFDRVARAANEALGVDILSIETSALFGAETAALDQTDASRSVVSITAAIEETFRDFRPENEGPLRPGTSVEEASDLFETRHRIYSEQRNLFLTHTWRPSETPGQVADISIRIEEHRRRRDPYSDRPLSDSLVEKVEYHVGRSWFGGRSVIKTNAEEGFKLDISAYGTTLCLARVHFKDSPSIVLQRFLDFPPSSRPGL
jgi:hypothetical protein